LSSGGRGMGSCTGWGHAGEGLLARTHTPPGPPIVRIQGLSHPFPPKTSILCTVRNTVRLMQRHPSTHKKRRDMNAPGPSTTALTRPPPLAPPSHTRPRPHRPPDPSSHALAPIDHQLQAPTPSPPSTTKLQAPTPSSPSTTSSKLPFPSPYRPPAPSSHSLAPIDHQLQAPIP
jgi:hypothetical protein